MPKKSSRKNQNIPTEEFNDTQRSNQFFQNLLDTQMTYNSPSGSSSNPAQDMGFAKYASSSPIFTPSPQQQFYHHPQHQYQTPPYQQFYIPQQQMIPQQTHPVIRQPIFQSQIPTQIPTDSESEENVDTVPETQPEDLEVEDEVESDPRAKGKKKVRCKKVAWTDAESVILAKVWMQSSELTGTGQTKESFWGYIRETYNAQVKEKRRADQLTGKWSKMSKDIKIFIGHYTKLEKYWQSGNNMSDIVSSARHAFKEQTGRNFLYENAWQVLKDCPKFLTFEGVVPKRKVPEVPPPLVSGPGEGSGGVEGAGASADPRQFETLFHEVPLRRPPGRASTKSQRSSGSSDAASQLSSNEARSHMIQTANATKRAMDRIYDATETRDMLDNLSFLSQSLAPDLTEEQRNLVLKARTRITKKYQKAFEDSDDEE